MDFGFHDASVPMELRLINRALFPGVSGGGPETGQTRDYEIELK